MCPQCGNPPALCREPDKTWHVQREVCYSTMALASIQRRYDTMHEAKPFHDGSFSTWTEQPTVHTPYHYSDGVRMWVSEHDMNPDDNFLGGGEPNGDSS